MILEAFFAVNVFGIVGLHNWVIIKFDFNTSFLLLIGAEALPLQ